MTNGTNGTRTVHIEVRKVFMRAMQEDVALQHIAEMTNSAKGSKWTMELMGAGEGTDWYREIGYSPTTVAIFFEMTGPNSSNADIEIDNRIESLIDVLSKIRGTQKWILHSVNGETWKPKTAKEKMERAAAHIDGMVAYAEIGMPNKAELKEAFHGLFGIDAQLEMLTTYMETSIESDFRSRTHAVLLGPPGCGKSQTLMKIKRIFTALYGDDVILNIDGTAMTSAGITKTLDELETMPRYIFIEEIDKAPNEAVAVLLGLMDKHGELRKTTFRKNIAKDCRVCVFATANSLRKLRNMQEGALFSRFTNPITYTRPEDDVLKLIVSANMDEMGIQNKNRDKWIERALAWCHQWHDKLEADTLDPRFVISMVVNGRDALLTGKYQANMEATSILKEEIGSFD